MSATEPRSLKRKVMKSRCREVGTPSKNRGPENLQEALKSIANLYSQSLESHGFTPKSVGWKDGASQRLRFEKLTQIIDLRSANEGITVNDWGCGYGAMFSYLDKILGKNLTHYYGYDISDRMLTAASHFVKDRRAEWIKSAKITHKADYSFASGTFNVRLEANDALWTAYIKEKLLNLACRSVKGFAFNLLSTYVDWKQDNLYYGDPFMFFNFCKQNISRYVSLLHDYPLYEWTIIVRKKVSRG
jgi:SAM-dependent methyltransferase